MQPSFFFCAQKRGLGERNGWAGRIRTCNLLIQREFLKHFAPSRGLSAGPIHAHQGGCSYRRLSPHLVLSLQKYCKNVGPKSVSTNQPLFTLRGGIPGYSCGSVHKPASGCQVSAD